jgi:hypothetical protein
VLQLVTRHFLGLLLAQLQSLRTLAATATLLLLSLEAPPQVSLPLPSLCLERPVQPPLCRQLRWMRLAEGSLQHA